MLGLPGHHRAAGGKAPTGSQQGQVDRLGAARAEDDLAGRCAHGGGGPIAGGVQRVARGAAFGMGTLGVGFGQVGQRGAHLGQHRRPAGVVEVGPRTGAAQAA
ncbi:MAG: hypothetical protein AUG49_12110 [Catenulispora sp. 13_1_20CM_3_70_7]|nr:MAG: hypothetical protein AUG49_12110 [Catenulispora sp. 13_1_20CM_3_70_7]